MCVIIVHSDVVNALSVGSIGIYALSTVLVCVIIVHSDVVNALSVGSIGSIYSVSVCNNSTL